MQLIERSNIDIQKWDKLIDNAYNGNIYGYSWYLDIVAPNWKALVLGDYDMVLPIPTNRKKLIEQVYHPIFSQYFDIYALEKNESSSLFFHYLEENFSLVNIKIKTTFENDLWTIQNKINQILSLNNTYENIFSSYKKSLRKNIRKTEESKLHENLYCTPHSIVEMYDKNVGFKIPEFDSKQKTIISDLIIACLRNNKGFVMGVDYGKDNVVASGFFINSHNRIINIFGSSTKEGNKVNAMSFMIDKIIKDNAQTHKLFDFEGSNIPTIYNYFKSFGATEESYHLYSKNSMPSLIKGLF